MADVLVSGIKISEMELVNDISGTEKMPTDQVGDKAVSIDQILIYVNNKVKPVWGSIQGDIDKQTDLMNMVNTKDEFIRFTLQTAIDDLQEQINALGGGASYGYTSYAVMVADAANIPPKSVVTVGGDPDPSKDGMYIYDGTTFSKSPYDPLQQSKNYTSEEIKKIKESLSGIKTSEDEVIDPILVDGQNKALVYYDKSKDRFEANGLKDQIFERIPNIRVTDESDIIPVLVDKNGKVLIGWDKSKDKQVGISEDVAQPTERSYYTFETAQQIGSVNHMLWYGESLAVGAAATTILSTSQPYSHLTFNTSPRKDTEATSIIPLREFYNNPAADGGNNRGETCCSGAANYFSVYRLNKKGEDPSNHVVFASTAGHGGYRLDQLIKGTSWYPKVLEHVNKAKELLNNPTYTPQVCCFIQGANDAAAATQTPKAVYKPMLQQLQIDVDADVRSASGTTNEIRFMLAQISYGASTWPDQAQAHLEVCQESDKFMYVTPMYLFPHASDAVHLNSVGYKWMGAYFGRAYDQYIYEQRKPDYLRPLYCYSKGDQIFIKFDVPKAPLVLDTSSLAPTTDYGFKVKDGSTDLAIANISVELDTVILKMNSPLTSSVKVRYGFDYLGAGLNITGGGSGNLRDSTSDSVVIDSISRPLYHACPHFEMSTLVDKGV